MSQRTFTESVVEQAALAWLESLGWRVAHGPDVTWNVPGATATTLSAQAVAQLQEAWK